jgi:homoserine kinase
MKPNSVEIVVPASTSNLGSGLHALGVALKHHGHVRVTQRKTKGVNLVSPIPQSEWAKATVLIYEAFKLFFARTRKPAFGIDVELGGEIPHGRGLGASASLRVGILAALDVLAKTKLDRAALLDFATELEGHANNAAASIFGGFVAAGKVGKSSRSLRFEVSPKASFVCLVPNSGISLEAGRESIPHSYNKADALHGINRTALVTAAFAAGELGLLKGLFDDRMHQPHREPLIPQLSRVIQAGEKAGALGGWLSGSGSSIVCLTLQKPEAVGKAMQRFLSDSELLILRADNQGFTVR